MSSGTSAARALPEVVRMVYDALPPVESPSSHPFAHAAGTAGGSRGTAAGKTDAVPQVGAGPQMGSTGAVAQPVPEQLDPASMTGGAPASTERGRGAPASSGTHVAEKSSELEMTTQCDPVLQVSP